MIYTKLFPYFWLLSNWPLGRAYVRARRELRRNEQMSEESLRQLQWKRLKRLLEHAYENVPFYRRRFDQAGVTPSALKQPQDLGRLPIVTRKDLQENLEDMVATNVDRKLLIRSATGGSTGTPTPFYETLAYKGYQKAVKLRASAWEGFQEGQKVAVLWGADRDIPDRSWLSRQLVHHVRRERLLNCYKMTDERMADFAELLIQWKPRLIMGYARATYMFASFLKQRGIDQIRPVAVETGAEKLWDYQRTVIEDVFRCKVFDFYGSREVPGVAGECEMHRGLHVFIDNVYLELLRDGRPVNAGEEGEIIITALTNYAMPLIRYQNEDLARATDEKCPCGRPFPLIAEIIGRANDVISTPNGQYVHGAFFNHLFFAVKGIEQYQVHQKSLGEVNILIQSRSGLSPETLQTLKGKVLDRLGPGVSLTMDVVDRIAPTSTGKHRYIVSEVRPSFLAC